MVINEYSIKDIVKNKSLKTLLIIFFNFNISEDKKYFYVISSYKSSKFLKKLTKEYIKKNNDILSKYSELKFNFEESNIGKHIVKIKSENLSIDDFITIIYKNIQIKKIEYSDDEFEKIILISLFGLRGSMDFNVNYYSVDIYRNITTAKYLDYIFKLLTNIENTKQLNLNFRELQEDYSKNQRNTQIRINLRYFIEKINCDLSCVNIYKDEIIKIYKENIINEKNMVQENNDNFIQRLLFYREKVLNKIDSIKNCENKNNEIKKLRAQLKFEENDVDYKIGRSSNIITLAKIIYPDECVCCKNIYKLENRSFKMRKNQKYYLEIHHVVSFASDKKGDQIDNLVKICPTCHKALTKNRAEESYQKELIKNILINSKTANSYVSNFFENPTIEEMVDFIYEKLQ